MFRSSFCCLIALCYCLPVIRSFLTHQLVRHPHRFATENDYRLFNLAAKQQEEQEDGKESTLDLRFSSTAPDDERKPIRQSTVQLRRDNLDSWGVERTSSIPHFPSTVESLTDAAWKAVAGAMYGKQIADPNIARNAMSQSIFGYRPVHNAALDSGRVGIEIDGAQYLFTSLHHHHSLQANDAIRLVALRLASKLSGPWDGFEKEEGDEQSPPFTRPVAVYFNTIKQSLVASQELTLLRQQDASGSDPYANITIKSLGQDPRIPENMRRKQRRKHRGLAKGKVIPRQGIVMIVQPTDFNDEFRPPGPAVDVVASLQQLVARASTENLPVVVISPRFLSHHENQHAYHWDQSGYQQSATYGGDEPPKGPTPWILRDFTPPAFVWVANALALVSRPQSPHTHHQRDELGRNFYYSRIALMQSAMEAGHAFHVFAAKQYLSQGERGGGTQYQYLASTKTSSGRPTSEVLRTVFGEWSDL